VGSSTAISSAPLGPSISSVAARLIMVCLV